MESRPFRELRPHPAEVPHPSPDGAFVTLDGETYYRISAYHRLAPFMMSLASDTDLWMFVTSGGGLTAGRVDAEGALFPYLTVDRLHDAHHHTGPLTLVRLDHKDGSKRIWAPFADPDPPARVERNLYKSVVGNRLVFEEIDPDLGLAFRYGWAGCDAFGWVRTVTLENLSGAPIEGALLDGLRNVLPWGAPLGLHQTSSNLVDAYKRVDVDPDTGLGVFSLTAGITDRAEALEVLRANAVWCCGLEDRRVHLMADIPAAFRDARLLSEQTRLAGARGNYFVSAGLSLAPGRSRRWHLVADAGCDHLRLSELRRNLLAPDGLDERVDASLRRATESLRRNVAAADGLQHTGVPEISAHHFANVLFNNMRGGVFDANYEVPVADFVDFLETRNRQVARRHRKLLAALSAEVVSEDLLGLARQTGDPDFERLCHEYLPLHYGRRHGDPSRPWNRFSIHVRNGHGRRVLSYEGNWRDIFQNWEALCASYPGFLTGVVAKFVNASTVDGFNPYRITREGVDWEVVESDDPWSNIGYWGDHQIVYLLKLLEGLDAHEPGALADLLNRDVFSYAEVPYAIKPYADIVRDPGDTIDFDAERDDRIAERVASLGTDGKLLRDDAGAVVHVNLLEKLLVPMLAKLSNLVPGAGIWMNTQRPEWNDANNALGGGGVSVVTLGYLRRYLVFLVDRLDGTAQEALPVSAEVAGWLARLGEIFAGETPDAADDPVVRRRMRDALGEAFSDYRATVYADGPGERVELPVTRALEVCRAALDWVDAGLRANRREDGLYHAYNLLADAADGEGLEIRRLPEMLEGQVAILSSGLPDLEESRAILEQLYDSALYRMDQHSFMLYPERELPGFLERNAVPEDRARAVPLLNDLLDAGDGSILARDADGVCRFHGDLGKADHLEDVLDALADGDLADAAARDREAVLALFEETFQHSSYTGRSGVMYGYEGLGCIYWHMVAKLLLAVQELVLRAEREGAPAPLRDDLAGLYVRIRAGLGYHKSVSEYGAFPTDPYSHTPSGGGAKQPGMTGQVKEEILTRFGELGVRVADGRVAFRPTLLEEAEFVTSPERFRHYDVRGEARTVEVPSGGLAFTYCQVPVIYVRGAGEARIRVEYRDGAVVEFDGDMLDERVSGDLFSRSGRIGLIRVDLP